MDLCAFGVVCIIPERKYVGCGRILQVLSHLPFHYNGISLIQQKTFHFFTSGHCYKDCKKNLKKHSFEEEMKQINKNKNAELYFLVVFHLIDSYQLIVVACLPGQLLHEYSGSLPMLIANATPLFLLKLSKII